jgi:hypothetical protein
MSQSDYIQYKKTQQILKDQTKMPKILGPNEYTMFAQYTTETTIPNTKLRYSRLIPSSTKTILDMYKTTTNCPTFVLCKNTNTRPNRVLNTTSIAKPTFKLNKIENPTVCTFTKTNVTRVCSCSKTICKCGTTIYTN